MQYDTYYNADTDGSGMQYDNNAGNVQFEYQLDMQEYYMQQQLAALQEYGGYDVYNVYGAPPPPPPPPPGPPPPGTPRHEYQQSQEQCFFAPLGWGFIEKNTQPTLSLLLLLRCGEQALDRR
jgi:hypothetical protein